MKKVSVIVLWILVLCLLAGCGGSPAAAPTETPTEAPATLPPATPTPTEKPPERFAVDDPYYTLYLPAEWKDLVSVEHREQDGRDILSVYHEASRQEAGGHLFSLTTYDSMDFVTLPSYHAVGELSNGERSMVLVAMYPTDVQAAMDCFDEYFSLFDTERFAALFTEIEPKEGWTLAPVAEDSLYAAQARLEYWNLMEQILAFNALPDGSEVVPEGYELSNDAFAVFDVDGDGREELLLNIDDSYMAGMRLIIYRLDEETQSLTEELVTFPAVDFYEQGVLRSYASHNQTYGTLWPYALYRYSANTRAYELMARVEGWDRQMADVNYDGDPFPTDVDADGNGSVAYISDVDGDRWVDDGDLAVWEEEQFGSLQEITPPWLPITQANVDTIRP